MNALSCNGHWVSRCSQPPDAVCNIVIVTLTHQDRQSQRLLMHPCHYEQASCICKVNSASHHAHHTSLLQTPLTCIDMLELRSCRMSEGPVMQVSARVQMPWASRAPALQARTYLGEPSQRGTEGAAYGCSLRSLWRHNTHLFPNNSTCHTWSLPFAQPD